MTTNSNVTYDFFITEDGSPSLRREDPTQVLEAMHHSGGALTESLFIYGEGVRYANQQNYPMRILSVGLGLGYNEMIASGLIQGEFELLSFEKDPHLSTTFVRWLNDAADVSPFSSNYNTILAKVALATHWSAKKIKDNLRTMHQKKLFSVQSDLLDFVKIDKKFHVIFYDAFSKKASPLLWQQNFLESFLSHYAATPCVLCTYAATGNLRRALEKHGFQLTPRTGFLGKRQSTFAIKCNPNSIIDLVDEIPIDV